MNKNIKIGDIVQYYNWNQENILVSENIKVIDIDGDMITLDHPVLGHIRVHRNNTSVSQDWFCI